MANVRIPPELLPLDGRFGCGPSKVRPEQVAALAAAGGFFSASLPPQALPSKRTALSAAYANGLSDLFRLPERLQVVSATGGSTAFWDTCRARPASSSAPQRPHSPFRGGSVARESFAIRTADPWIDAPHVRLKRTPAVAGNLDVHRTGVDGLRYPHNGLDRRERPIVTRIRCGRRMP